MREETEAAGAPELLQREKSVSLLSPCNKTRTTRRLFLRTEAAAAFSQRDVVVAASVRGFLLHSP